MKHKEMEKIKGKGITDKSTEGFWMAKIHHLFEIAWECLTEH